MWKGDITVLEDDSNVPPMPLNARQVTKQLQQIEIKALEFSIGLPIFVMVRDRSNQVSREKYLKIHAKLNKYLSEKSLLLEPKHVGLNDWESIAPTIEIAFFSVKEINCEQLEALVKEAVYVPAKNAKKDMFRITAHGAILI